MEETHLLCLVLKTVWRSHYLHRRTVGYCWRPFIRGLGLVQDSRHRSRAEQAHAPAAIHLGWQLLGLQALLPRVCSCSLALAGETV